MPEIPIRGSEPGQVWIQCQLVNDNVHPWELVVQFKVNGNQVTSFVRGRFVDTVNNTFQGIIVADFGDSQLIDIPAETFTSGSRIRVKDPDKSAAVVPVS